MRGWLLITVVSCCANVLQAQSGLTCAGADVASNSARVEGRTELQADVLVRCTGGTPTAPGATVPRYEILVISNSPLTNRLVPLPVPPDTLNLTGPLTPVFQWNDALLLLDDASPANQIACVPAAGGDSCPAAGGSAGQPNVFQGQQLQQNAIVFRDVPIDSPGPGKTRTIRITNVRADALQIPVKPAPAQVHLTTQIFDGQGNLVPLSSAEVISGDPHPSYAFSMRTVNDGAVNTLTPVLTLTPAMVPQNNPGDPVAFNVKFTEGFADAFKRRNLGTSGSDPNFLAGQADPGAAFHTESGLFNNNFPLQNNLSTAGLADSGTRLRVALTNIPDNVRLWVSGRDVAAGTTDYDDSAPHAVLLYSDDNGGGPFSQNLPPFQGFSEIWPTNGATTLVWEVVAADASKIEEFSFTIKLVAPNGIPRLGTAMLHGSLGPIYPGLPGTVQPSAPPTPSFADDPSDPVPAFRLVATLDSSSLTIVSAASFAGTSVAPDSIVSAFASNLTDTAAAAISAPVPQLANVSVDVIDNAGNKRAASLYMASPGQINMVLDPNTRLGEAVMRVTHANQVVATGTVNIASVAPGLFSARSDGTGLATGSVVYTSSAGNRTAPLARYDPALGWQAVPINLDNDNELAILTLFGTGIRGRSDLSAVSLTIGGQPVAVNFAGPQGGMAGLDQIDAGPLPRSLRGRGDVPVALTVGGKTANQLTIRIQ